jgi:hypothetical protein
VTTAELDARSEILPSRTRPTLPFRTNPHRASLASAQSAVRTTPSDAVAPSAAVTSTFNFDGPTLLDAGAFPPDTMGSVGPAQFVVAINGRFRSYDKATGIADGVLNADPDVFFSAVMTPPVATNFTSDPHIRYDRLTQRWMIVMIDVPGGAATLENRVLVAVSSGPVLTGATVWTEFFFNEDAGGPDNLFADYPTLGVDANALYVGMNMFVLGGSFSKTNMYVIRKSSILGAGPLVVTRFDGAVGVGAGPFTPQGVDNFDPAATTGYFVGVDNAAFSLLQVRKVTDPGGAPVLSGNLPVTVPTTRFPILVDHLGNTGGSGGRLDGLDDRLFAAQLRNGHIWTAHNIGVNAAGVGASPASRDASRWYELDVTGTPALVQSGTIFDPAATSPKSYWIPTVAVSGQGTMAIGGSVAGLTHRADAWFAGRLAGAPAGQVDPPTEYTATSASYNPPSDPGGAGGRRWGDFSMTSVDPDDDMTMWTIQEYASSTNVWGTRVAQLLAPPPATPASSSPIGVRAGLASTSVTVTGTSAVGSGFFDPGAGFSHRLQASVGCGVVVTSAAYVDPTHVQLDLDTTGMTGGPCDVTVTNPDGQAQTGVGILALLPPANDNFVDAQVVSGPSGSATGSNVGATKELGEPTPTAYAGGASIWYRYIPAVTGALSVDTCGTPFDTLLGVYTGAAVGALTLAGDDDESCGSGTSAVTVPVTGGVAYSIEVDGWDQFVGDPLQGPVTVHWMFTVVPSVTGFTPVAATQGKTITVLGSGFTGATGVAFAKAGGGTVNATTFGVLDDGHLSVLVPRLATTGLVSVTTPAGPGTSVAAFRVKPKLRSFTPASGPTGTVVTIKGSAFTGASKVTINGTTASFLVVSDVTITITVPVAATTGLIQVTTGGGRVKSKTAFTVT